MTPSPVIKGGRSPIPNLRSWSTPTHMSRLVCFRGHFGDGFLSSPRFERMNFGWFVQKMKHLAPMNFIWIFSKENQPSIWAVGYFWKKCCTCLGGRIFTQHLQLYIYISTAQILILNHQYIIYSTILKHRFSLSAPLFSVSNMYIYIL